MRRGALFSALGALLLAVGWWMFFISPRNGDIDRLDTQRQVAVDDEARLRATVAQLEEIRDNEVEYIAAIGQLEALIPERPLLEEFIEQIDSLALETSIDLLTVSPSLPVQTEGTELREIVISVEVEGEFFELIGFLFGLSDLNRLVRVDGVSLASSTQEDGGTVLNASLELRLFTLADLLPLIDEGLLEDPAGDPPADPPADGEPTQPTGDEQPTEDASAVGVSP